MEKLADHARIKKNRLEIYYYVGPVFQVHFLYFSMILRFLLKS